MLMHSYYLENMYYRFDWVIIGTVKRQYIKHTTKWRFLCRTTGTNTWPHQRRTSTDFSSRSRSTWSILYDCNSRYNILHIVKTVASNLVLLYILCLTAFRAESRNKDFELQIIDFETELLCYNSMRMINTLLRPLNCYDYLCLFKYIFIIIS